MPRKHFTQMKWWERVLFCMFYNDMAKGYTYQSVVVVPLFVSFVLNSVGIVGMTSCIVALIFLAVHTSGLLLGEHYYNKYLGGN